ncbi:hypothetical protein Cch01nite_41520 [Cellulomonas chitinilytica]|uniref:Uncharacterized protein n=1 Tax=Cellulomonas chitinilytica TaxID=398759 RepID=A0A919P7I2_9CELL|nr:hypothetical protein Cch01nite_41520 [Cellulomonas chitinilytica]
MKNTNHHTMSQNQSQKLFTSGLLKPAPGRAPASATTVARDGRAILTRGG